MYLFRYLYTLIRDFTFKGETKIIDTFKIQFINGIANLLTIMARENLQRKWNNQLKIINAKTLFKYVT